MCVECWKEYGSPVIDNEKTREASRQIRSIYETRYAGGGLHIVLDDFNIEDEDILWCIANSATEPDELELANLLLSMDVSERASAVYHRKTGDPQ